MKRLVLLVMLMFAGVADSFATGLFGMVELKIDRIDSIPKWGTILQRTRAEDVLGACRSGRDCDGDREDWQQMIQAAAGLDKERQMIAVNDWANRMNYITDIRNWGVSDYWATPGEFIERSGDCEDFAIAKYYSLRALGWPESALRMVVVHDAVRDIPHAVLAVRLGDENYILDNLTTEPLPDRYVRQYTPYYAVNARSRWVFVKPARLKE